MQKIMNFIKKWYIYQKERFPIIAYGLYCFCLVFGTFCFCMSLNKKEYLFSAENANFEINYYLLIPLFIVSFLQFLMVRIVDEFKDYEEDCKYRPYRPVPRGLITLKELKVLFIICAFLQVIITIMIRPKSLVLLGVVWLFFAIMSKVFFIKIFLDKHILVEVLLDELLLPITVIFLSSFMCKFNLLSMWKFLAMTYIISWIIEIARKIRCKEAEENGVKTYTAVFGILKATMLLWFLETLLFIIVYNIMPIKLYIIICFFIVTIINFLFVIKKSRVLSKCVEYFADIYVMMLLISLIHLIV